MSDPMRYDVDNVSLKSVLDREEVLVTLLNARGRDGWRLAATIPIGGAGGLFPSAGGTLLVWERPDTA